ncbi:hypothetical protein SVTN_20525 [Streptomyces vietnamensis]|uniref:Uncharacterized protein n=2 Tax=Streptomyces vietnamensis TaxID=362257 RepID=A0A0B5I1B6_9ACTN|nr:hypothetical protein SVTN_20525 [Streptomyces vietnamensis]
MTEQMTETDLPEAEAPEAAAPEPEAPEAEVLEPAAPPRSRRVLWAVARWTAALVVCGGVGAGTAMGITALDRNDVPGLATESDGRWEYPQLRLPALPADRPRPFTEGNDGEIHYADVRELLLPAPAGATADPKLNGGFVPTDSYLSLYGKESRDEVKRALTDSTLRHVAARGWTTPDGTRTSIHLLRFSSVAFAEAFKDEVVDAEAADGPDARPDGVEALVLESFADDIGVSGTSVYAFREKKPYGPEQVRWAYVQAGDTLALITQTRKGEALAVPFQQTVTLQNQLLG